MVWRRGWEYLGRRPLMLVAYIVGSLLTTAVLPPLIALRFSALTRLAEPGQINRSLRLLGGADRSCSSRLNFGLRYLTTSLDVSVSNSLRRSVFLNILKPVSRASFHDHDTGQLTMIVNQFCIEAEMGLRQLLIDPILQLLGILSVGWALYGQLALSSQGTGGHQVAIIFGLVAVMALLSPWLVARMGQRLQRAMGLQQQQALTLSTLINGAVSAPEEIQAMRAEELFDKKHDILLQQQPRRPRGRLGHPGKAQPPQPPARRRGALHAARRGRLLRGTRRRVGAGHVHRGGPAHPAVHAGRAIARRLHDHREPALAVDPAHRLDPHEQADRHRRYAQVAGTAHDPRERPH